EAAHFLARLQLVEDHRPAGGDGVLAVLAEGHAVEPVAVRPGGADLAPRPEAADFLVMPLRDRPEHHGGPQAHVPVAVSFQRRASPAGSPISSRRFIASLRLPRSSSPSCATSRPISPEGAGCAGSQAAVSRSSRRESKRGRMKASWKATDAPRLYSGCGLGSL